MDDYSGIFETICTPENFKRLCENPEHFGLFNEPSFITWLVNGPPCTKKVGMHNTIKVLCIGIDECFFSVEGKHVPYRVFQVRWKNSRLNAFAEFEVEIFQDPTTKVYIARNFDITFYTDTKMEEFWEGMGDLFPTDT